MSERLVLLVSAGVIHPPWLGRVWLRRALGAVPGFRFQRVASLNALPTLNLDGVSGLVLYYHEMELAREALDCFRRFLHDGGGVLALHSATASFKEHRDYFSLLGGRFREHGPVHDFTVHQAPGRAAVFGEISPFTVRDELYLHDWQAGNDVHFFSVVEGRQEPVVWTRQSGAGRVAYCSLGHRAATLRLPAVQTILQRGLAWACR